MGYRIPLGIVILLAAVSPQTIKSQVTAKVTLDATKPIVYIKYDHAGPRQPVEEGEPANGLWLRLVNNSVIPIEVKTDGTDPDGNMVVPDIVASRFRPLPKSGPPPEPARMPQGYFSPADDLFHLQIIAPGKDLVIVLPTNHVAYGWNIQIPFQFKLPVVKQGEQPLCYAIFTWEDLPESYRTASANSSARPVEGPSPDKSGGLNGSMQHLLKVFL
jgi:hypothetical protein